MPILKKITPQNIRRWAYDEDLYFLEQDEDLMLHRPSYIPTLIDLAAQENCPKQEYIKSILEYYIQSCFLYKRTQDLDSIKELITKNKMLLTTSWLTTWATNFNYIYTIYTQKSSLTDADCYLVAQNLTIGTYCERRLDFVGTLADNTKEYLASTQSFKLYFYINPLDGQWKISTLERLTKFD